MLETCKWSDSSAGDLSRVDASEKRFLEADFAERRQKLLSSEEERAHWLSLFITTLLSKAEVTIKDVRIRLDDSASKQGGAGAGTTTSSFGIDLELVQLITETGVVLAHSFHVVLIL